MTLILLLSAFSLLAGFIDAVVGGGGLIQIPAMLILLPGAPVATILGTNKFTRAPSATLGRDEARWAAKRASGKANPQNASLDQGSPSE